MHRFTGAAAVAALVGCSAAAHGANIIELHGSDGQQPVSNDIEVNGQRARIIVRDGGVTNEILFDASASTAYVIDHAEKTFMELTEEGVAQMGTQLKGMMAQVQAQLEQTMAGMSEEQKAQMGNVLGNLGIDPGGATAPTTPAVFQATGEQGVVNGIPCDRGVLTVDGNPTSAFCVARRENIPLADVEYATLRKMVAFGSRIADAITSIFPTVSVEIPSFDVDTIDGLPVEISDAGMRIAVTSIREEPRPPIALPDGYTRQTNPLIGQ